MLQMRHKIAKGLATGGNTLFTFRVGKGTHVRKLILEWAGAIAGDALECLIIGSSCKDISGITFAPTSGLDLYDIIGTEVGAAGNAGITKYPDARRTWDLYEDEIITTTEYYYVCVKTVAVTSATAAVTLVYDKKG